MQTFYSWLKLQFMIPIPLIIGIIILILTENDRPQLPYKLGVLNLQVENHGQEAHEIINNLHTMDVTPEDNFIGWYGTADTQAVLYLSIFESANQALAARLKMVEGIKKNQIVLSRYQTQHIEGLDVSLCHSLDRVHYFFTHKNELYWLAVDMPIASQISQELIVYVLDK